MTRIYEGMFLIDNDVVRAGWHDAKKIVAEIVAKHGGTPLTARRWDERRLAYPIKKRNRATFLLSYFELDGDAVPALARDLELGDAVLRNLIVRAEAVPEAEKTLSAAEDSTEFIVPEPPADDAVDLPSDSVRGADEDTDDDVPDLLSDEGLALAGNTRGKSKGV